MREVMQIIEVIGYIVVSVYFIGIGIFLFYQGKNNKKDN